MKTSVASDATPPSLGEDGSSGVFNALRESSPQQTEGECHYDDGQARGGGNGGENLLAHVALLQRANLRWPSSPTSTLPNRSCCMSMPITSTSPYADQWVNAAQYAPHKPAELASRRPWRRSAAETVSPPTIHLLMALRLINDDAAFDAL